MFIHPFHDVTFRKMELEAVIDKVTLDMSYESKQKEAIMLLFLQKRDVFVLPTGFGKGVSITFVLSYVLLYGFPEQTDV